MNRKMRSDTIRIDQSNLAVDQVEAYLNSTLEPISPRREFVDKLRGQLAFQSEFGGKQLSAFEYLFFALAGVISSVILLVMTIRAVLALLDVMRYFRQDKQKLPRSKTIPIT